MLGFLTKKLNVWDDDETAYFEVYKKGLHYSGEHSFVNPKEAGKT